MPRAINGVFGPAAFAQPHSFPAPSFSIRCRFRLRGGARHQRGASGRHAARQQQRQLPAPPSGHVRAFRPCHQDLDDGGGCRLELQLQRQLELELETRLELALEFALELEQHGHQSIGHLELELMRPKESPIQIQIAEQQSRPSWD